MMVNSSMVAKNWKIRIIPVIAPSPEPARADFMPIRVLLLRQTAPAKIPALAPDGACKNTGSKRQFFLFQ